MKKTFIIICSIFCLAVNVFAATITIDRKKPSELDLSFAKTIHFMPVVTSSKSYAKAEKNLIDLFISEMMENAKKDGKFTVKSSKETYTPEGFDGAADPDVYLDVKIDDFRVTDNGITIGDDVDKWSRIVGGKFICSVIDAKTKKAIETKEMKLFEQEEDVPRAKLQEPDVLSKESVKSFAYVCSTLVFDVVTWAPISIQDTKSKDKALKQEMKDTLKILKKKDYETAKANYEKMYTETNDPAAAYNYARLCEITNDYAKAKEILNELYAAGQDKKLAKTIEEVEKAEADYNLMQKRLGK